LLNSKFSKTDFLQGGFMTITYGSVTNKDDTIDGSTSNDIIDAGNGNDFVFGNLGKDACCDHTRAESRHPCSS